jgi:hypothetical protein
VCVSDRPRADGPTSAGRPGQGHRAELLAQPPKPSLASEIRRCEDRLEEVVEIIRRAMAHREELLAELAELRKRLAAEGGDPDGEHQAAT